MLGLLVILVISWGLLYLIESKNIEVLGIIPKPKRCVQFLIGFLFIVLANLLGIYIESVVKSVEWQLKPDIDYYLILKAIGYHLRSALTEDLIFRGAILYILIHRIGLQKGILISALFFGVYHVFSYGMTGDRIVPIVYVVLVTGFTGYVWGYTFYKTKSILMPLGFHLGYNLIMVLFYPSVPYGELIVMELSRTTLSELNELYYALFKGFFPSVATLIFVKLLLKSKFNFLLNKNKIMI